MLLDFVPVHFAVNDYALWRFDGTSLFEYPHSAVGYSEWGSCNFMHSRGEVRSFLLSAAHYWMKEFHFDGLRIDAVRNLLYWQGDEDRGVNQSGVQFLKDLNRGLKERFPQAVLVAEDSSQYPGVTALWTRAGWALPTSGIWAGCTTPCPFFQAPPQERLAHPEKLTFSLHYFYKERYLLPLSHDEVGSRQGHHPAKDERGQPGGQVCPGAAAVLGHVCPPWEKAELYGQRAGHVPRVGRKPPPGLGAAVLSPPRRSFPTI